MTWLSSLDRQRQDALCLPEVSGTEGREIGLLFLYFRGQRQVKNENGYIHEKPRARRDRDRKVLPFDTLLRSARLRRNGLRELDAETVPRAPDQKRKRMPS